MKCFEIGKDDIEKGLRITVSGEPRITVGVGEEQHALLLDEDLAGLVVEEDAERDLRIAFCDIETENGESHIRREKMSGDLRALVRLDMSMQPGKQDKIQLTSNCYDEKIVDGRVVRDYRDFPPVGVKPIVSGFTDRTSTSNGEPVLEQTLVLLLEMLPSSAFRIIREGVQEKEILITWSGYTLRQIVPGKYRNQPQPRAA
jgi:hypothetical protein